MLIKLFSSDWFIIVLSTAILLIILIGVFASLHYRAKEYNASHLSIFVRILGSLGILLFALEAMIYAAYNQLMLNAESRYLYTKTINQLFLEPLDLLTNEKIRPEFAASFKYSNLELFNTTKNLVTPITTENILNEDVVFHNICQGFEDLLNVEKVHNTIDPIWIAIFLEYSHSKFFQEKWKANKFKYNETTEIFIELLITYANQITIPVTNPQEYLKQANIFVKDPKFQELLASLQK